MVAHRGSSRSSRAWRGRDGAHIPLIVPRAASAQPHLEQHAVGRGTNVFAARAVQFAANSCNISTYLNQPTQSLLLGREAKRRCKGDDTPGGGENHELREREGEGEGLGRPARDR